MRSKYWNTLGRHNSRLIIGLIIGFALISSLLLYKLASLTGGLSRTEELSAIMPVGWRGIYQQPFYLPLKVVRSVVFYLAPDHGQLLTRLPNALFGGIAIAAYAWLIRSWHGARTAILATLMFATSAWVLHVSRLASFDVMYLAVIPVLLLTNVELKRNGQRLLVWFGVLSIWSLLLFIPGIIWLVLINAFLL